MSEKLFFYDVPILELYFDLLDELITEQATNEWNMHLTKTLPQPNNKLSTFKLCNPFWLTYFILRGIFKFLFSNNNKVVVVKARPIKYRNVNDFSDDDTDESEIMRSISMLSKGTQTDRRDLERIGFESALTDLINLRKFKDIVPANRRAVRGMSSNFNVFRRIDDRNRYRFGGKVIKSKLKVSGTNIFGKSKTTEMEMDDNKILSVHEVLNHLLYVESSDDENVV